MLSNDFAISGASMQKLPVGEKKKNKKKKERKKSAGNLFERTDFVSSFSLYMDISKRF